MRFAVIGHKKRYTEAKLLSEGRKVFGESAFVPHDEVRILIHNGKSDVLHRDVDLSVFGLFLPRVEGEGIFSYLLASSLSKAYSPIQPISFIIGNNKVLLYDILTKGGIKVPAACLADSVESAEEALREMEYPVAIRAMNSKEVSMFALNKREVDPMIKTIRKMNVPVYLEERLTDPLVRCYVVGGEVTAIRLKAKSMEKSMRGVGSYVRAEVDDTVRESVIRASRIVGAKVCRVDIREGSSAVVNVNVVPPLKNAMKSSKVNICRKIVEFMKEDAGS